MVSVIREQEIETSAEECWSAVADFGALHTRLATGFILDCTMIDPEVREVTFSSGSVAKERLIGVDPDAMRLAYSVIESARGSTHNNAAVQVYPLAPNRCRFVWAIDVLPHELGEQTAALMDAGLRAITATLERR